MLKIKKAGLLTALALIAACGFGAHVQTGQIRCDGRVGESAAHHPVLYWPGSSIHAGFEGSSISVVLNDRDGLAYYNAIVDGYDENPVVLDMKSGPHTYPIATGLSAGPHKIELFRRTMGTDGPTEFCGFELDDGAKLLAPPSAPKRRIEFYGDSITCGDGNEADDNAKDGNNAERNNYLAYGAMTARNLNAEYRCIARSGIGIMKSWYDLVMPDYWYRLDPQDPDSRWDFSKWAPDVVVVNLFQNDSWLLPKMDTPPTADQIVKAYVDFVSDLRKVNPDAHIVCALGSMDATRKDSPWPGYIHRAVEQMNDPNISELYFPFTGWRKHPRVPHHQAMAEQLTEHIRNVMQWDAEEFLITSFGAAGNGRTLNTEAIQSAIDAAAAAGGGTVVVPKGEFVSGALFLKPGVNLHLEKDAVLRCSTDMKNFPEQRTRIEGHFEDSFNPALINADGCDGLVIDGEGTLDGDGKPIWDIFWKLRNAAEDRKNFKNLSVPRARLCLIENSKNVTVRGITFKDSQFWNLHIYKCDGVLIEGARFQVPDDYKQAPSTDAIDLDSTRNVVVRDCWFSVTDDCVAFKGTKGPFALEDKDSPPVENIRVTDCVFKRGHHAIAFGSEATIVRNVVVEDCVLSGWQMPLVQMKLRPDTPQCYENVTFRNIEFQKGKSILMRMQPWTQYFDLQDQPEPTTLVRNITFENIHGDLHSLGVIEGNSNTVFGSITLKDVDVKAVSFHFDVSDEVKQLDLDGVDLNGKNFSVD